MKALVIIGPTGVGKTDLSIRLAGDKYEIISADSVQIYKYLNIGSGKPSDYERRGIPHYMMDVIEPDEDFTAGDFCKGALEAVENIKKNDKIPLFAGGTGFYIDSFFQGLSDIPKIDSSIREELIFEYDKYGLENLYNQLLEVDKNFALKIDKNDKQRIIRGLEVFKGSGKSLSYYYKSKKGHESIETIFIGLNIDRTLLYENINLRVDRMIENGFIKEVVDLRERGYDTGLKSMKSIGYCEINQYLDGNLTLDSTIEKIKQETRRYAKRQLTWFRRNKNIRWFKPSDYSDIIKII